MPAPWQSAYLRAVTEARAVYEAELLPAQVEALYLALADAIERIAADLEAVVAREVEGRITAERAEVLRRRIQERLDNLQRVLYGVGGDGMAGAAELAALGHAEGVAGASAAAGVEVGVSFASVPERALRLMVRRRGYAGTFQTLIRRHLEEMAGDVERYLTSAVARGVSARRGSLELAKLLSGNDPAFLEVLGQLGPRGGRIRSAIAAGIEIPEADLQRARTLLQDTYRITVHETNTAYHEADRLSGAESPVVDLVRWTLSGRHPAVDSCDLCAEADLHGYGPGLYHPAAAPPLQHPFCLCKLITVLRPPEQWGQSPRPVPGALEDLSEEEAKRILEQAQARGAKRKVTPKFLERQRGQALGLARLAHDVALGVEA